jgi:hypothetical protein
LDEHETYNQVGKLEFILEIYVNICKLRIFEENIQPLIDLKLQKYIDDIPIRDADATLFYFSALVDNQWEYYFSGLAIIYWTKVQWIKFTTKTFITFPI